jgi:DNA-binding transcriptional LysR family regulator
MDRLQSMRVFARVAERGSLAAVAREMDLSPAVVTRLVADLEAHLNVRLLNRTTRRVALTDVGAAYLERVRQILAEIDEAEALASAATHEPSGPLRMCVPPAFASHQFARHLPAFASRYPRIAIDLEVRAAAEVPDETADVSVLITARERPPQGDFIARLLATTSVVVCAAPSYFERRGRPQAPRDLAGHETLIPALPHVPREWHFVDPASGRQMTVPAQSVLSTGHVDTLLAAACAGLGLVALPSFVVSDALREGRLERAVGDWKISDYHVHAAWRSRKYLPARTRAMLDFLVETFGGEDRDPWLAAAPPKAA